MIINLQATPYETKKKGEIKRMRKDGKIPAILYGHKEESKRIYIEQNKFREVLDVLRKEAVTVSLKVGDENYLCVIKAIQHNPITNELIHIDFQHIHEKKKVKALIPIHVIGEPPGVKKGGILDQHLHEVVVRCLPADIPSHLDIDVSNLDLGQAIHLQDIDIPRVDFELGKETTVVSILIPRAVVAEVKPSPAEEAVEEEKKEGEEVEEAEKTKEKGMKEKEDKVEQEKEDKQKPKRG